jgi:ABC-type glycerol-3-phosphate transport system permease component
MESAKLKRPRRHPGKKPVSEIIMDAAVCAVLLGFTLLCAYPFYYLFINTISSNQLSSNGEILFFPRRIHFTNYAQIFRLPGLLQAAFISLSRTVLGTVFPVFCTAFLGFMFTQRKLWLRAFWYRFVLATMYFSAGLIPWYLTMMNLGLLNNFLAYIIPALVQPFNIILVKTYIESTPKALQESAEIDGAGVFTVFKSIVFPIITPILATIAIFCAVGQWNNFTDTLLLMTDQRLFTLQYVLYQYLNQASSLARSIQSGGSLSAALSSITAQTETSIRMTISIVVILPIIFTYPFFQRYFVQGIMVGAVKG